MADVRLAIFYKCMRHGVFGPVSRPSEVINYAGCMDCGNGQRGDCKGPKTPSSKEVIAYLDDLRRGLKS